MIDGIRIKQPKIIRDERGQVMHMLRRDDQEFYSAFGEVYFSIINPGVVKAWKRHLKMTQNLAVPRGQIKLVIYDDRPGSLTQGQIQEIITGENNYQLIKIPPMLWYGFQCVSQSEAMLANCSDMPHDPSESQQLGINEAKINYQW
jgi:dTDP-4-dehydrorhamnose 3,5-epimerase